MRFTLFLISIFLASSLLAVDATVEVLRTTPVTLLWSDDAFYITSGTNKEIIPLANASKLISRRKSSFLNLQDLPDLYYQRQVSLIGGKEEDTSFFAFSDLDGNEIQLKKGQSIELLRLEFSVFIDGEKSRIVLWKQQE